MSSTMLITEIDILLGISFTMDIQERKEKYEDSYNSDQIKKNLLQKVLITF